MTKPPKYDKGCGCTIAATALICSVILLTVYCIFYFPWFRETLAEEAFDSGHADWVALCGVTEEVRVPDYRAPGENRDGHVEAADQGVDRMLYWSAPAEFCSALARNWDTKGTFRAHLYFSLRHDETADLIEGRDIVLSCDEFEVYFNHATPPVERWTAYAVSLNPDNGWSHVESNESVSKDQMHHLLSNLRALRIRGEFRSGDGVSAIDNIIIR